jgi:hypothetical protein
VLFLTEDAHLICKHVMGNVSIEATQSLVTINKRRVLIKPNPEGRSISGCPNFAPTIKPCTTTLAVQHGYSTFIRIDKEPVCLQSVTGLTDGTPPGVVKYIVEDPGQQLVQGRE